MRFFGLCGSKHRRDGYPTTITPPTGFSYYWFRMVVPALRLVMPFGEFAFPNEDRAEQEVLNDGQFSQYFREVHLHHSLVYFVPGLDL